MGLVATEPFLAIEALGDGGDEKIEGDFAFVDQKGLDVARGGTAIGVGEGPLAREAFVGEGNDEGPIAALTGKLALDLPAIGARGLERLLAAGQG